MVLFGIILPVMVVVDYFDPDISGTYVIEEVGRKNVYIIAFIFLIESIILLLFFRIVM
jgi:hypothetical protein